MFKPNLTGPILGIRGSVENRKKLEKHQLWFILGYSMIEWLSLGYGFELYVFIPAPNQQPQDGTQDSQTIIILGCLVKSWACQSHHLKVYFSLLSNLKMNKTLVIQHSYRNPYLLSRAFFWYSYLRLPLLLIKSMGIYGRPHIYGRYLQFRFLKWPLIKYVHEYRMYPLVIWLDHLVWQITYYDEHFP